MDIFRDCCAGFDVHKKTVVVCVRRAAPGGEAASQARTFGTMAADLLALSDWLREMGVRHVAMESTGVYWKPIWHVLEGEFELVLVNAAHIKQAPGRKTDVKGAEWIAQLHQYGLLKPSFVPPRPVRELRDLTRQRARLIADKASVVNRIHKTLEDANIKLSGVATDIMGASGRAMIARLIGGEADPNRLAAEARGRLKKKVIVLRQALDGRVTEHHRFLLRALTDQLRQLEELVERYTARIEEVLRPLAEAEARLRTIPGVGARAAEVILAEIGADMGRFATAAHLASRAEMSPGNDQSAGRRRSGRTTKGDRRLRQTLTRAARAASHTEATYLSARYHRLAARRGRERAIVAPGHTLLTIIYYVLKRQTTYVELGADFLDRLDPNRLTRQLVKRLEKLGRIVTLEPRQDAA